MNKSASLFLIPALFQNVAVAKEYLSVEQAQKALFPNVTMTPVEATGGNDKQPKIWKAENQGWFIIDRVLGKHEYIVYAVALNPNGEIKGVEVLIYRESYGQQVKEAAWLKQFHNLGPKDSIEFLGNIKNISGATLSCRHLTEGVKKILDLYNNRLSQQHFAQSN